MTAWAHVENIVLVICSSLLAYLVSPWCLLILLLVNMPKDKKD